jgi:NAD(P)-dependent dehydrogenase (short-subunit alcohol dehydrogenase family)
MAGRLVGRVALVAGATRGAGRGIARMLGEAGATVYCSGRSSRAQANTSGHHYAGRPETIEETAELVTAAGGRGIPVRVDHTVTGEVAALMQRIRRDSKRLDILVNVITGQPASWGAFWKQPFDRGRSFLESWLWPHLSTCWHAVPLMVTRKRGLIVEIVEQEGIGFHGALWFDLMEATLKRLVYGLACELAPHGVSAVAISPGFMRTEAILEQFGATERNWREAAVTNATAKRYGFISSETPCFVGRAVAALAADPDLARKSGAVLSSWALADEYGLTDLDGARPNMGAYLAEHHPDLVSGLSPVPFTWRLVPDPVAVRSAR